LFTDKQIELLQNFAAQAVIAIENARLLNELRESLRQQTATADVLKVISRSTFDLKAVLKTLVESAAHVCEADICNIALPTAEGTYQIEADYGQSAALAEELRRQKFKPGPGGVISRTVLSRSTVHILDAQTDPDYQLREALRLGGYHTMLGVPMLREGNIVGVFGLARTTVRPFTEKQIELVTTFADQAVIAIENTRLLNELRQRTTDLTESLEQQTATSKVLDVISRSAFDLQAVFETVAESSVRLCGADRAFIFRFDGELLRMAVAFNVASQEWKEYVAQNPIRPGRNTASGRAALERRTVHIPDVLVDPEYTYGAKDVEKVRTVLAVPILKGDDLLGVMTIYHLEVRPFTDKQIALVETFADQAAIAIENVRLLDELRQSLQQQTTTADVLKVISRSTFDLQVVLDTLTASAARLCEADKGTVMQRDGDVYRPASNYGYSREAEQYAREHPVRPDRGSATGRVVLEGRPIHIPDVLADPEYQATGYQQAWGYRTLLGVPLLREGTIIGTFSLTRSEVRPFSDKQIELVTTFADQAVIAIENARLLSELRQRTTDLTESLEQQTATSEVLRVISSSLGALEPVFDAILANASHLCAAKFATLNLVHSDNTSSVVAMHNVPDAYIAARTREPRFPFDAKHPLGRVAATKQVVHIADVRADESYRKGDPSWMLTDRGGARTVLLVPMLKENELIGAITVFRQDVRPFTDKQIVLVQNFAAQAVIAIENTRLLNELRQSLQQQTATADVLKIISRSTFDLTSVLQTLVESAAKLCDADSAQITRPINGVFYRAESYGFSREFMDYVKDMPVQTDRGSLMGRVLLEGSLVHIPDVKADPEYTFVEAQKLGGYRASLGVPMLREGVPIGVLSLNRSEVRPFTDKQIELVTTFADQAVIAIENARLLNELRESLDQQSATADVLKIISRSTFDLRPVLQTLVESAARFCAADKAHIIREKDGGFYTVEAYGYSLEFMDYIRNILIKAERGTASGRALAEGHVVHIADVKTDSEYTLAEAQRLGDYRTVLCVPMLREGVPIGVLSLTRSEVQPFTDKQIELVTTFADQAAIAIENVRLFDEIQDKSRQLEEASQHKSQFLANMSHELRTPLNAILGYTELMADGAYGEPSEKMLGILKRLEANGKHLLGLINDVLDLSKIEAGQLMLELSDYCIQDIAQTVRSTLEPLASDKKLGFKVEVASQLPSGRGDGRRLTQVLINLVGNAIKFTDAGEVAIKAEANNGSFHVSVRDTGPGISSADQAKLFQEFQQADNAITRKKGGTGLGLAISKRIIEMHGGRIWVESQPGQGSTFTFTLPVIVERQVEAA
jgi:GAF domain-containing protein